jgi:hypothetical protein
VYNIPSAGERGVAIAGCKVSAAAYTDFGAGYRVSAADRIMSGGDWLPHREQDFNELCEYWTAALADPAKRTAFGWDAAECTRVAGIITNYTGAWHE